MRISDWSSDVCSSDLRNDLRNDAGTDGAAAFADRETQAFVHGDRRDQLDVHRHVVTRHHHLDTLRQLHHTGHVGGAEVELRAVVGEERRMTATLFLDRKDVVQGKSVSVRVDLGGRRIINKKKTNQEQQKKK